MTAQLLTSELSTLIQESKRKNPDLRTAAEKSLSDLKSLPSTSEAQIAADLKNRPFFVQPFILACGTRNAKFAGSAVICLQRLIIAGALPKDALEDVLGALRDCASLALDIQLKVLQALPSLLQNFSENLSGNLLATAFQVCFLLYTSKTAVVSHTAAAALQQLVNSTFEKATINEQAPWNSTPVEVPIGDGTVTIWGATLDAYRLLEDICLLTEGKKAKHLPGALLAQTFGLELLQSILTDHIEIVTAHPEQIDLLRIHLMPLITKTLSEKASFSLTVRTMRLLQLILSSLLFALASECEMALSLLNHMLDPDAAVLWKRVLCLELFRSLHAEPALMRNIYARYDQEEDSRNVIRDHLSGLVRLASEKPAIIGLGQQSSVPALQVDDSGEQAAMQAGGLVGSIGASVSAPDINTPGISTRWSSVRVPCIDMLDKSEPPPLPATYIYLLALTCITSFSEGLTRFMLPFTLPSDVKSKRRQTRTLDNDKGNDSADIEKKSQSQAYASRKSLVNPLSLKDHMLYRQISTSAHMVDQCWPALLAASSTYLNASMDSENFHALVRSFQKFTQIAGLLDLVTPRDAFLTTLGKHGVPSNTSAQNFKHSLSTDSSGHDGNELASTEVDLDNPTPIKAPIKRQQTSPTAAPTMNTRHLLCLRALLNLGIALGPVLHDGWSIILETLQQADLVISLSGSTQMKQLALARRKSDFSQIHEDGDDSEDLSLEITAAETAASRMFESTNELPNDAFLDHLQCICALLRADTPDTEPKSAGGMLSPGPGPKKHQKLRSISGTTLEASAADRESIFLLEKLAVVIRSNVDRLLRENTPNSGWDLLANKLTNVLTSQLCPSEVRVKAATCFNQMAVLTATVEGLQDLPIRNDIRARSFGTILREIRTLHSASRLGSRVSLQCELDIHAHALDSSRTILEHCGDSLALGWSSVFSIVNSIFDNGRPSNNSLSAPDQSRSAKLVHSSFGSLQLICSDFLGSVPSSSLLQLLDTLFAFSDQNYDLNISLTTTTFFRNVSDYLLRDQTTLNLSMWESEAFEIDSWKNMKVDLSEASVPALWLYLVSKLVQLTTDVRDEVRHSAMHTLFRILDSCGDQLDGTGTFVCFKYVLVKALSANEVKCDVVKKNSLTDLDMRDWNKTALLLVEGTTNIFSSWVESFAVEKRMPRMCDELLIHLTKFLDRQSLSVSKTVFKGLTKVLSVVVESPLSDGSLASKSWQTWLAANPVTHIDDSERNYGNQNALLAYIDCLRQLLRLTSDQLDREKIKTTLAALRTCITGASASAYISDVNQMTLIQQAVLESLRLVPTKTPAAAFELLDTIAFLVTLAYKPKDGASTSKQTYLGVSKASMSLLESFVAVHLEEPDVEPSFMLTQALIALAVPMHLKYKCEPTGKPPSPWRKSISAATAILEKSRSFFETPQQAERLRIDFWNALVYTIDGIVLADHSATNDTPAILRDQDADIAAFYQLRTMIIPTLGLPCIADSVRIAYAATLFQGSLLHEPHPDDLPQPNTNLLSGLQTSHIGRVQDLPPFPRSKFSYILLDDLFNLVTATQNDRNKTFPTSISSPSEHIALAQATAPHLILRCALTLKAYIYDQPLRGLLPQPWSQKREMLYILRKLNELDSEPRAFSAAGDGVSKYKNHLYRLYPLLIRALRAAKRDEEMSEAIREVLVTVGEDLGG